MSHDSQRQASRILITGGAGFIGSHIAQACVERGDQVCVVDDLSTGRRENLPQGCEFVELDICDEEKLRKVFREFSPTGVSHQAAQTSVSVSTREPVRDARINVMGTIEVIRAARENKVGRFVFASTGGAIYGEVAEGRKANQSWVPAPKSPYACSKFAAEQYVRAEDSFTSNILRYANVYGPRQDPHGEAGVVAIFGKLLLSGQPCQINAMQQAGDSGCIRDYVYVGDVVRANLAALDGELELDLLDVGTGIETCTKDLAVEMAKVAGAGLVADGNTKNAEPEFTYAPSREGDLARSVLDSGDFERVLGRPLALQEGLRQTMEWFRQSS